MKILVIGDPHARPEEPNHRFDALASIIIDKRPDHIVCIGDMADMGSLSSYDVGRLPAEGKRYIDDLSATHDACNRMTAPVWREVQRIRKNKKKRWTPQMHMTLGNHEMRIVRAAESEPRLHGTLSLSDLKYEEYGFNVVPFLSPLVIEDIAFQHYFTSGVMGRPIGGDNCARSLINKGHMSSVVGHSHLRDYSETTRFDGKRVFGLVAGCYDTGDHHYTTEQARWWSGLVMLNDAREGYAEPAFFSMEYVLEKYL